MIDIKHTEIFLESGDGVRTEWREGKRGPRVRIYLGLDNTQLLSEIMREAIREYMTGKYREEEIQKELKRKRISNSFLPAFKGVSREKYTQLISGFSELLTDVETQTKIYHYIKDKHPDPAFCFRRIWLRAREYDLQQRRAGKTCAPTPVGNAVALV